MEKIKTALVLCAGYGKRLRPLTDKMPKPLLKIRNITLLENTLNLIKNLDIENVLINTFYLKEQIKDFININKFDLNIKIIEENEIILDTGGGIYNMIKNSGVNNFITFNPDTFWSKEYVDEIKSMEVFYFSKKIKNILMVVNKNLSFDKNLNGDFSLLENQLNKQKLNQYIFTGCQIINKKLFSSVKNKSFSILQIWNDLIKENKLYGYESKNKFYHVTDLEIYNKLLKSY